MIYGMANAYAFPGYLNVAIRLFLMVFSITVFY